MEQNYNEQNTYENPAPQQEQAPYAQPAPQQPVYQQPYQQNPYGYQQPYQAPVYPYQPQIQPESVPGLTEMTSSAFGKGLASVIMAEFPIASIFAIVMGSKAKKQIKEVDRLTAQYGTKAPGKRTAAKILGNIGFGLGIGMTVFWAIFFLYMLLIVVILVEANVYY